MPTIIAVLLLVVSLLAGCGGPAQEPAADRPPREEPGEIEVEAQPEGVSHWGFDQGAPEGWEHGPEWVFDDGSAVSGRPGQGLFSQQIWGDFDLFTRVQVEEGTIFGLVFRAGEGGENQFLFEPGAVALLSGQEGEMREVLVREVSLAPGWHELHLIVRGAQATLMGDEGLILESGDLGALSPGALGFINHSDAELAVDFVEVHEAGVEMAAEGEPPEGEEPEVMEPGEGGPAAGRPPEFEMPDFVIRYPPRAGLIDVGSPGEDFTVTITGQPGAVEANSLVVATNLETTRLYFAQADGSGAFQLELFAYPGSSIQIKHATPDPEEAQSLLAMTETHEFISEWLNTTAGTIVRVPAEAAAAEPGAIPFSVGGFTTPGNVAYWLFEGEIQPLNRSRQSLQLRVVGTFYLSSQNLQGRIHADDFELGVHTLLVRHFDQDGNQDVIRKYMVSDFLSPTGFPIYHGDFPWSPITYLHSTRDWRSLSQDTIAADVAFTLGNDDRLPLEAGYYGLKFEVNTPPGLEGNAFPGLVMRSGVFYANGGFYSPLFKVGEPQPPHLYWTLLTDTLHEATRGTTPQEEQDRVGMLPMISFQSRQFILQKDDPKTGEPLSYRLEPFLPLLGYGDRGVPNPPTIDFAFPSGELRVTVTKPDGTKDELGPAPFLQSVNATPGYDFGKVRDYSNAGGAVQEVYQLTTLDEAFAYTFELYGRHVIEMSGTVDDVHGNTYTGGGTYEIWVAQPLKLYGGMLPASPFIEGDRFSPSLQVYPRMPAEMEMQLQFLPQSSLEGALTQRYNGTANPYGYYFPQEAVPFVFQDGGEYRVDVTASYWDEEGRLWMGSAAWGNVVENSDTPLIAHGIRGLDSPEINNLWFFHKQLEVTEILHTFFPYHSGDIFWGHDLEDLPSKGANSIIPGVSLEDTSGEIYDILRTNWETKAHGGYTLGAEIDSMIQNGELIPFTTTSTGLGLEWFPEQIDQYGYAYYASERPGARVHEALGEGNIPVSYWRYGGTYGDQVGVMGDLSNDLKWQYGGVVFRDLGRGMAEYAAYASLWVLIPDDDPIGGRVTPPFQGATGGPNGGPIMTLKGEEIDLLFLPRSGFPGQVLEVGDVLSFSGHVGPPLDSKVTITVTSPDGEEHVIHGQANQVGYFYQPGADLIVDQAGVWTVVVEVVHDGMTSSGPTTPPYPSGGVLGAAQGRYAIYVVEQDAPRPALTGPSEGFLIIQSVPIPPIAINGRLPAGFEEARYDYTIAMPGFILEQGQSQTSGAEFNLLYDPVRLHEDFPNLDLVAYDAERPGLADQVWIAVLFESGGRYLPLTVTLHGEQVFHR
jgi:hypothetical protein